MTVFVYFLLGAGLWLTAYLFTIATTAELRYWWLKRRRPRRK